MTDSSDETDVTTETENLPAEPAPTAGKDSANRSCRTAWITAGALSLVVASGAGFAVGRTTADHDQRPAFGRIAANFGPDNGAPGGRLRGGPGAQLGQRQQGDLPQPQSTDGQQDNNDDSSS